jgi:hypothetical protein
MADLDEAEREAIKKLVQAFERIDDSVIEACQDAIRRGCHPPITEDNLRVLKASRDVYRNSDYDVGGMVQYLKGIRDRMDIWDLGMRSIGVWLANQGPGGRYWLAQIQIYGEEAWKLAVSASHVLATDGSDIINAIIAKFAALDTILDEAYEETRPGTHRERFSDEFRDTVWVNHFSILCPRLITNDKGLLSLPGPLPMVVGHTNRSLHHRSSTTLRRRFGGEDRDKLSKMTKSGSLLSTRCWLIHPMLP